MGPSFSFRSIFTSTVVPAPGWSVTGANSANWIGFGFGGGSGLGGSGLTVSAGFSLGGGGGSSPQPTVITVHIATQATNKTVGAFMAMLHEW
jgi:hypothetical protein